jgi:hypothetical protein
MSSSTSRGSPPSGYGAGADRSSATMCPPLVLTSTASMTSTPCLYIGGSGVRVALP